MTLSNAASILAAPPGSLAYHLILTISLGLLYAVSQAHLRQTALPRAGRWTLAAGWLVSLRLFFLAAALLNWIELVGNDSVLPALGHFIDFAGMLVFAWAFLVPKSNLRSDRILMTAVVLNVVALGLGLVGEQLGLANIGLTQPLIFTLWQGLALLAALAITLLLLFGRPPQWRLAIAGFLILAIAYGAHLALLEETDLFARYVRLAHLLVYPLLVIAGSRALIITRSEEQKAQEPKPDLSKLNYTEMAEANIALALASLASATDPTELADRAAQAVAETMRAEYCLLVTPPDPPGTFSISTGYDLIREQQLVGAPLDEERSPVMAEALRQGKSLNISSRSRAPDVYTLQSLLGLPSTGPGLLVPISRGSEIFGGLLLLSPYARRSWSDDHQNLLENIADHLAERFSQFRTRTPASGEAYDVLLEAQQRIHQLEQDNMRLFEMLHANEQVDLSEIESISTMSQDAQDAEETIALLEAEIESLKMVGPETAQPSTPEDQAGVSQQLQDAYEELMQARSRIEQLEAEMAESDGRPSIKKRDLEAIASIAQELRQPMSSVLGYTDLLLGESVGLLGAMQRKFLERVRSAVERMGNLVRDLVQMTALESGTLDLQPTRVDLLSCVEEAVGEISPALREKHISLQMDFPDEVPAVFGDEMAISQIMVHLLRNAIIASPEGKSVLLSARVEPTPDQGFLLLSVTDSGEGIPAEDLGRVFQRLYPANKSMIPGLGEEGVGLTLVKGLSEALGGRVWVESELGEGSTFTVLLPLAEEAPTEAEPEA
ncbi:MAG: ATP-binding protein [Anaerolineales bacterium]